MMNLFFEDFSLCRMDNAGSGRRQMLVFRPEEKLDETLIISVSVAELLRIRDLLEQRIQGLQLDRQRKEAEE